MAKCRVRSVRKCSAGSTTDAAWARVDTQTTAIRRRLIRRTRRDPSHISQEVEIGERRQVHTGQRTLRHSKVRLVPEADIRHVLRDNPLHLLEECEPPGV